MCTNWAINWPNFNWRDLLKWTIFNWRVTLSSGFGFSPSYRLGVSLKNLLPSGPTSANIDAKATLELEWDAPLIPVVIDQFDLQGSAGIVQTRLGV